MWCVYPNSVWKGCFSSVPMNYEVLQVCCTMLCVQIRNFLFSFVLFLLFSRLRTIVDCLFPRSRSVVPRDTSLTIFVKIVHFIAQVRIIGYFFVLPLKYWCHGLNGSVLHLYLLQFDSSVEILLFLYLLLGIQCCIVSCCLMFRIFSISCCCFYRRNWTLQCKKSSLNCWASTSGPQRHCSTLR